MSTHTGLYHMCMLLDRRTRKRLATRQAISDAATRLFFRRGFDTVTIDEIAEAADVGRKTVFNHFARKEDMFFDRNEELSQTLCEALRQRGPRVSSIEALRSTAHQLIADQSPLVEFSAASQSFMEILERSETLKARSRAAGDELAHTLAEVMRTGSREMTDLNALLAAALFVTTWTVAVTQASSVFRKSRKTEEANAIFLAVVDQGASGVKAALRGSI
jgi:AcrR family transcriptional regulator